ncbi:MAG: Na(+)/H(+) antiporter subunit D [Planctomycetes bacterium]|nr:Na(+)/H(+) antiporter subunit D [Planctomycetota bacterium]
MIGSVPPAVVFLAGALLIPLLRGKLRAAWLLALPLLGAVNLLALHDGANWGGLELFGHRLILVRMDDGAVDSMSFLFGVLFHIAAFLGILFALHVKGAVEQVAAVTYAGAALGAVFAGDLITLFVCWELLAVTSVFLIWARKSARAYGAGMRYLMVNVVSGLLLLAGILVHVHETGSVTFGALNPGRLDVLALPLAAKLMLAAFGIKCAFPLLHNWLTDAYPEATPTGTVFLSAFTTKVAVYALARSFAGTTELVWIGTAMACFPIFFAVIENDLRRVLGYSMINQIGFMVAGVGVGTALGVNGAVAHAFNDVLFKGLLFMSMGAVLHRTGKINGSDLGGLYKSMPVTAGLCLVGAASISAFPLFSGFVSKSMVMAALAEHDFDVQWFLLLFASAGVFHHAGIKIPFFAFYAHDSGIRCREAPLHMLLAMGIAAALCLFNGMLPNVFLYRLLPLVNDYQPYDLTHVITQSQLLFWSAMAFTGLKLTGLYPPELRSTNIDAEWTYRKGAQALMWLLLHPLARLGRGFETLVLTTVPRALTRLGGEVHAEERRSRGWLIGTAALIAVAVLLGYLLLDFVRGS